MLKLFIALFIFPVASWAQNVIVTENALPGNPPSEWDVSGAGDLSIQGFATDISVNKGATVHFKIDTDASDYTIQIYRLGYYQGNGARLIGPATVTATLPQNQPAPLYDVATGLIDCGNWAESAHWDVPATAVSGIYIAKLIRTDNGGASHIVFVVRDDSSTSDLYFQTSDATWQAYNVYGGNSLYVGSTSYPSGHATKVSYNRPFITRNGGGGGGAAEDWIFNAEYPMVRWLERNGFDVSYTTCIDADRFGSLMLQHKIFMSVGHDEYWSAQQRANVETARNAGIHLAFFSGNEIYWKTRWENSIDVTGAPYRTLVCYKEGDLGENVCGSKCDPSPTEWTGLWRNGCDYPMADGCNPENALSGQISWDETQGAIKVPAEYKNLRFWRNTSIVSLLPGETAELPEGTLGYEWDFEQYTASYPAGRIRMSETFQNTHYHHLSLYRHTSGALVFGAGTVQWSWGLDGNHDRGSSTEDSRMQQATINLLADMQVQPGSLQTDLVTATASTDFSAPVSSITFPLNSAVLPNGVPLTVTGTASDNVLVAGIEISTDGGSTWHVASGTTAWSYTFTPFISGPINIKSRAFDDSGNLEIASVGIIDTVTTDSTADCPCTIFQPADAPVIELANDGQAIELGVKFQSSRSGYITGLRYYKGSGTTGLHKGHLWTSTGSMLAEATFVTETAVGWQEIMLSTPVAIDAHTTYIASCFSSSGDYSYSDLFFTSPIYHGPLKALANGEDGPNGVYIYVGEPAFPSNTYQASNYWVDVVFTDSIGPDTIPPVVLSTSPAAGTSNISIYSAVTASLSEAIDLSTLSGSTFELRDAGGTLVPAIVSYNAALHKATLTPSAQLSYSTTYTATIKGGTGYNRIKDIAGNAMATNHTWSFTTAPAPLPFPTEGPGGPILVISSSLSPYSRYPVEILRAEGFNEFTATDINSVNASMLTEYQVIILGEINLSPGNVTLLTNWVNAGGTLIAFRPDVQLSSLMGLTSAGSTLPDKYLLVNTSAGAGTGIVGQTIQYHGPADLYTLSGASAVAMLYSNATTPTTYPAVTTRNVGSNGGQAIAFVYDLARSVVYTRQGNPAWAGQKRDGESGPIRPDDQFYPDWTDLNKVAIPQADEQQHLLSNLILQGNMDHQPLPRFWFLPKGLKAAVVMTGDNHGDGGMKPRFDINITESNPGCSVDDWECIRSTGYLYVGSSFTDSMANYYNSLGFEVALHVNTDCANFTATEYNNYVSSQLATFQATFPSIPVPVTNRNHCIAWSDWSTTPETETANGIRFDVNYYYWPESWVADRAGMFTGSGMPMRFAKADGSIIDCYQAPTQMPDESGEEFPIFCDALLDKAIGPEGYYGVFVTNMHFDQTNHAGANAIVASAKARQIPVVSAKQMLTWLDARNNSSFGSINWSGNQLAFTVTADPAARNMKAMLPMQVNGSNLISVTHNGSAVTYTHEIIKGIDYAFIPALGGNYIATYSTVPLLEITAVSATPHVDGTAEITWTTNIPADSKVGYDTSVTTLTHTAYNSATVTSHSVTLSSLTAGETYYYKVNSIDGSFQSVTFPDSSVLPLSFTMPLAYCAVDETSSDFAAGSDTNTMVTQMGDGEIILQPVLLQDFSTMTVPAGWNDEIWDAQPGAATTYNGDGITVNGTHLYTSTFFGPSTSLEFAATFSTGNFQNIGYTGDAAFNNPWVVIGRGGTSDSHVYARTSAGESVSLGSGLLGVQHVYRIERNATTGGFQFYVDGVSIPTPGINLTSTANLLVQLSDYPAGGPGLSVDWLRITPYNNSGTFTSQIFDHGDTTAWQTVNWTDSILTGTTLNVYTRGGNSPIPDASWSAFQPLANGGSAGISARYLQYKVQLATTNPGITPVLKDIHFGCSSETEPCISPIAYISTVDTLVCQGGAIQLQLDSASGQAPYTLVVNGTTYNNVVPGQIFASFEQEQTSLWGNGGSPANANASDGLPIETGVKFRASVNGFVTGVRFYKGISNTGIHTGSLWSNNGTLLATAVYADETGSGWQEVKFATPVYIEANTTYIASYYSPGGGFAITPAYFTSTGFTHGALTALQSGIEGPNGVYAYGGGFPSNGNNANYWVDLLFMETQNTDTISTYILTGITDNNGCTRTGDSLSVTRSTISAFASGNITASGPSCNGQNIYLTFNANSGTGPFDLVVNDTTYHDVISGTPFNTGIVASSGTIQSIWNNTSVPGTISVSDSMPIELGLRFRSDITGKVKGVRFYKSADNTGPHIGSLWTNGGVLLASATFSSETASGWQEVYFSSPVDILANTTYVVSYHTTSGHYSFDANAFATSGIDNGNLHALQDNADERNGVYKYSAGSDFPTDTYNAANYWVDVVFTDADNAFILSSVTSANGCSVQTASNPLVPDEAIPVSAVIASQTDVACKGQSTGSATLQATGGSGNFHYLWNDPLTQTNDTATGLSAGLYTVNIIDLNGCHDTTQLAVTITEPVLSLTAAIAQTNVHCYNGSDGEASVSASGGTAPYHYTWTNSSVNDTISLLSSGTYAVMVNDARNCTFSDTITITQPAALGSTQFFTVCAGDTIRVGTQWYNLSGTYADTLVATNGCDSVVTTNLIVLPVIDTIQSVTLCHGESITIGTNTYSVSGLYSDVLTSASGCDSIITTNLTILPFISTVQNFTICSGESVIVGTNTYSTTGIYTDTLVATNSCDSIVTSNLTVLPAVDTMQNLVLCNGESITIGTNTYSATGLYTDTLAAVNGCDSTVMTNLVILPAIVHNQYITICEGDSIYAGGTWQTTGGIYLDTLVAAGGCDSICTTTLTVNPRYFINTTVSICAHDSIWLGGNYQHLPGIYYDTLFAHTGCDSIIASDLIINTVDTSVTVTGDSLYANASGTSFQWIDCSSGLMLTDETNALLAPMESGVYAVVVTENSCSDTSTCYTVDIDGIEEFGRGLIFNVYPNPANDQLNVLLKGKIQSEIQCRLLNLLGETVIKNTYENTSGFSFGIQQLSTGTYLLEIKCENLTQVVKVIKE